MLTYTTAGQILDTTYFCGNKDSVSYCTCITQCAVQAVKFLPYLDLVYFGHFGSISQEKCLKTGGNGDKNTSFW